MRKKIYLNRAAFNLTDRKELQKLSNIRDLQAEERGKRKVMPGEKGGWWFQGDFP